MKKIGKIVNIKGLKGEVKILSDSDFKDIRFKKGAKLYLKKGSEYEELIVSKWGVHKNFDIIKFKQFNYIDEVEKILNLDLYGEDLEEDILQDGEYLFEELKNCDIIDIINNKRLGKVIDVFDQVNKTYLKIQKENKKESLLPYVDSFIKEVDIDNKKIYVELIEGLLDD